jgi:uncharacterized protein (TIGR03435 family)
MISNYCVPLANHLWQSSLFAAGVWILALTLRKNRAALRHRLWFAASVKFLVPFSLLVGMGSHFQWLNSPYAPAPVSIVVAEISQPFALPEVPVASGVVSAQAPRLEWVSAILLGLWIFGFAASLCWWFIRCRELRRVVRRAMPLNLDFPVPVMSCRERIEPGVFGVFRSVLLVPEGITDRLSPGQLRAVLAHELCHISRRDNITAAIHMFVEGLFWFFPLLWWIKGRLIEEQERACDEEVLLLGSDPQVYAASILKICEFCVTSPLMCAPGIMGADLKRRIRDIMKNQAAHKLGFRGKVLLIVTAVAAVGGPFAAGLGYATAARGQADATIPHSTGAAAGQTTIAQVAQARPESEAAESATKFEVATIKLSKPDTPGPLIGISVARLTLTSFTLKELMVFAYWIHPSQVVGAAGWMDSDKFDIVAKPDESQVPHGGFVPNDVLRQMLRVLLADRFKLKFHHEMKPLPVYALVLGKNGAKMKARTPGDGGPGFRLVFQGARLPGRNASIGQLAFVLQAQVLDRPVLDKTGLTGNFDFDLSWMPNEAQFGGKGAAIPADPDSPDIFTAVQEQLGLKLEPQKSPVDILMIDQADRPSSN